MALPLAYNVRNVRVRWTVALAGRRWGSRSWWPSSRVLLAMSQGFADGAARHGPRDNAIVVSRGSNSEVTSRVELEERNAILDQVAAARGADGRPLASWEWVSVMALPREADGTRTNVVLRSRDPAGVRGADGHPHRPPAAPSRPAWRRSSWGGGSASASAASSSAARSATARQNLTSSASSSRRAPPSRARSGATSTLLQRAAQRPRRLQLAGDPDEGPGRDPGPRPLDPPPARHAAAGRARSGSTTRTRRAPWP